MNTLTKAQRRNCGKLADLIETSIPENRFYMGTWCEYDHECGTTGCALGWAAMSGQFEGLGVKYHRFNYETGKTREATDCKGLRNLVRLSENKYDELDADPTLNGKSVGWNVVGEKYFGKFTYDYLFTGPGTSFNKAQVVEHLRTLAAAKE